MGLVYFFAATGVGIAIVGIYQLIKYRDVFFGKKA